MGHVTAHNGAAQRRICDGGLTVYLFKWVCMCVCVRVAVHVKVKFVCVLLASKQATG